MRPLRSRLAPALASILLLICFGGFAVDAHAQARPLARTSVFGQVGGDGIALSLNADYMLSPQLNARVGYSTIFFASGVPMVLSYHIGQGRHRLEVGGGLFAILADDEDKVPVFGVVQAGYRLHPRVQGWLFRAGVALVFDEGATVWPGISVGRGLRLGR